MISRSDACMLKVCLYCLAAALLRSSSEEEQQRIYKECIEYEAPRRCNSPPRCGH